MWNRSLHLVHWYGCFRFNLLKTHEFGLTFPPLWSCIFVIFAFQIIRSCFWSNHLRVSRSKSVHRHGLKIQKCKQRQSYQQYLLQIDRNLGWPPMSRNLMVTFPLLTFPHVESNKLGIMSSLKFSWSNHIYKGDFSGSSKIKKNDDSSIFALLFWLTQSMLFFWNEQTFIQKSQK